MEAVAVAHRGIVESAVTWSSETSNLANLFWDAAQVVLSLASISTPAIPPSCLSFGALLSSSRILTYLLTYLLTYIFSPSSLFLSGGIDKQRITPLNLFAGIGLVTAKIKTNCQKMSKKFFFENFDFRSCSSFRNIERKKQQEGHFMWQQIRTRRILSDESLRWVTRQH